MIRGGGEHSLVSHRCVLCLPPPSRFSSSSFCADCRSLLICRAGFISRSCLARSLGARMLLWLRGRFVCGLGILTRFLYLLLRRGLRREAVITDSEDGHQHLR